MLVKLGEIWVDPAQVEILEPRIITPTNPDGNSVIMQMVAIVTQDRSTESVGDIDEFASIINSALQSQSFGGESDEKGSLIP